MTDDLIQTNFYVAIANKIKIARQVKGVDQESLAQILGLTRTSIINIEKGRQRPSIYQIWLMARFLNIPVIDLIPSLELQSQVDEWKEKVENNTEIDNEKDQELVINFISATRQSI
jgi:transcriptional regulator with XRE-family HTH domain